MPDQEYRVDLVECRSERGGVSEVSAHDLGPGEPRTCWITGEGAYGHLEVQQPGRDPPTDLPGRSGHEDHVRTSVVGIAADRSTE